MSFLSALSARDATGLLGCVQDNARDIITSEGPSVSGKVLTQTYEEGRGLMVGTRQKQFELGREG